MVTIITGCGVILILAAGREGERVCVHIQSTKGTSLFYQLVAPGNLCLISLVPRPRPAFRYLITFVLEGVLQTLELSLVPRTPPFLPSLCVHNNTQEWKTGEKQGRPGSIHHVMQGGRGAPNYQNYPFEHLPRFRTPDLSVMETTCLDRYETHFQV